MSPLPLNINTESLYLSVILINCFSLGIIVTMHWIGMLIDRISYKTRMTTPMNSEWYHQEQTSRFHWSYHSFNKIWQMKPPLAYKNLLCKELYRQNPKQTYNILLLLLKDCGDTEIVKCHKIRLNPSLSHHSSHPSFLDLFLLRHTWQFTYLHELCLFQTEIKI